MVIYTNKTNYLLVELSGEFSLNLIMDVIHKIVEKGKNENINKVLVDIRTLEGNPSILDRYKIGLEISKVWGKKIQVASIGKKNLNNYVAENVAVNRGAKFRVFTEIESALEWLEGLDEK